MDIQGFVLLAAANGSEIKKLLIRGVKYTL